jgi:2-polyprenyl-3-methyl-5-hydroxy-6-metoxy-1,4-benzoquinol methylase
MNILKKLFGTRNQELRNWTKERLETFIFNETTIEHLHRYAFARGFIEGKRVLDIASGEGYGVDLMASCASEVIGVDIDQPTVERASQKYTRENVRFLQGKASEIPLENDSVDVVVSFETLEHTDKHEEMIKEVVRVMKPDGLLIMSSPDKYYYSDVINYHNPHHIKELYEEEFRSLIQGSFSFSHFYYQRYLRGSLIVSESPQTLPSTYRGNYEEINEQNKIWGRFLIAVATNSAQVDIQTGHSVFDSMGRV